MQFFHFPAVIVTAPLSCLILIGRELNNDRIEVGLIKEVALTYEEIGIDGPTASPGLTYMSQLLGTVLLIKLYRQAKADFFSLSLLIKVGHSGVSFFICPMKPSPNHSP